MRKRTIKRTALVLLCAGTALQRGGGYARIARWSSQPYIPYSFLEWVTDNDAVFDLFQDGAN